MSALAPDTPPERPWRALLAVPVAIAAVVTAAITYAVVSGVRRGLVTPPDHHDGLVGVALHGPPPLLTLSATLVQDLALVVGAAIAAAVAIPGPGGLRPAHFGLRPPRRPWVAAGLVVAGYVLFVVLSAAWTSALGITDRENVPVQLGTRDSTGALVGALLLVCVVAPMCEELFFRGYLFGALRRHGLIVAAGVAGLAFGLAHVLSSPIGFIVPLAGLGVLLCLLYERTGSLYPCIALHALNNSVAFGVGDGRAWLVPICLAAAATIVYPLSRTMRRFA